MRDFPQNTTIRSKLSFEGERVDKRISMRETALYCLSCGLHFLDLCIQNEYFFSDIIISWSLNLPSPKIVRPSANVTNCRPMAPPYNNLLCTFHNIFQPLVTQDIDPDSGADTLFVIHKFLLFSQISDLD